ncbi:hypothetical protein [Actinoplanes derwentensis]|uniref:Uncharacterized protein n=1 Tax=Actinoplanes derwentensis TaxID=113562 RepID=A0A1H2CJJ4_9ACTN|nr:hypothetical protein [Actinoplanes derwentensis]GID82588.1 hypothetical protein Ade03nite_15120 [Actinoplanes derwentensis]SDT70504.1 hypothetical protein SAMN04489716_5967 [Actinoplanes derwentensis]
MSEILDAIHRAYRRETEPARLGDHQVRIMSFPLGGHGPMTTIFRIRYGRVTLLRAAKGTYREDVAIALLDAADRVPADPGESVHVLPLEIDGFPLDRVVVLRPVDEFRRHPALNAITTLAAPAHRSEVRPGESRETFEQVTGGVLCLPLGEWSRPAQPRADTRLLDEWPGGQMYPTEATLPWPAATQLTRVANDLPPGVRLELTDVRGHRLVITRSWDRLTGTLFPPSSPDSPAFPVPSASPAPPFSPESLPSPGADDSLPVDVPRLAAWAALAPIFSGDPIPSASELIVPGSPEEDVLEMTYETTDRGHAERPFLTTLESCTKRIQNHILRTPGNWAVFTSRSGAIVQVRNEDHDPPLWLETPYPDEHLSRGHHVTIPEATRILTTLAREDRTPVPDLTNLQTIPWNSP